MKHSLAILLVFLCCLLATGTPAKEKTPLIPILATENAELVGGNPAKAFGDTTRIRFWDFETGQEGWTSIDRTEGEAHWSVSAFNAANLDPENPDNKAWWCGENFPPCDEFDLEGGYGPNWNTSLNLVTDAPDPNQATSIQISGNLNYNLEDYYDYLSLEAMTFSGWSPFYEFTGTGSDDFSFAKVLNDTDYVDGKILLRWHMTSDGGYDATDCMFPNEGAAQIDNIVVIFNGVQVGATEDCENPNTLQWTPSGATGVGDFAKLWTDLIEPSTCSYEINPSHQWAFIDDGQYFPDCGPSMCQSYCYGPGGYIVNPSGGLKGPNFHIYNEVASPPVSLNPYDDARGLILAFDQFIDLPSASGIYSSWSVRSSAEIEANINLDSGSWSSWSWDGFGLYGGPSKYRRQVDISQFLVEDARWVQVAVGVYEFGWVWGNDSNDASPSPYFDNIEVLKYTNGNYRISAYGVDLAQDSAGSTANSNPALHELAFNSARNTNTDTSWDAIGIAADSLVVSVVPLRSTSPAVSSVQLHFFIEENQEYSSYRSNTATYVDCWTTDGVKYFGDLDEGTGAPKLFPGDVLHYWFEVLDESGEISYLPADRTGYFDFTETSPYPQQFTWHGLPTVLNQDMDQPTTLLWDDSGNSGPSNNWQDAMSATGLVLGENYDIFRTTSPRSNQKNGIGYYFTQTMLQKYDTLVYAGGNNNYTPLESADLVLLNDFLDNGGNLILSGNHTISALGTSPEALELLAHLDVTSTTNDIADATGSPVLTVTAVPGNGVFPDGETWTVGSESCITFDGITIDTGEDSDSVSLADFALGGFTGASFAEDTDSGYSLFVFPYDLNFVISPDKGQNKSTLLISRILESVFTSLDFGPVSTFLHSCDFSQSDGAVFAQWQIGVEAQVDDFRLEGRNSSKSWTVPHIQNSASSYSAQDNSPLLQEGGTFEYTLFYRDDADSWQILFEKEMEISPVPMVTALKGAFPNPFNPSTSISYSLARQQLVEIAIYDLSGRQVVSLLKTKVDEGNHTVVWDGNDATGRRASSGTYFVKMKTESHEDSEKIMLIK